MDAELERLGVLSELTSASLARLETIPVDIRPCYPLAGENCDADRTGGCRGFVKNTMAIMEGLNSLVVKYW